MNLLLDRVSERDFYSAYPTTAASAPEEGLKLLNRALGEQDGVAAEFGLYLAHRFGVTSEYLDVLNALVVADWHERHEDVIAGLAKLRSPSSVEPLYAASQLRPKYLEYDDYFTLAKKAVHALKAIPTVRAIEKLGELTRDSRPAVVGYAKNALSRLVDEGSTEELRAAARSQLPRAQ